MAAQNHFNSICLHIRAICTRLENLCIANKANSSSVDVVANPDLEASQFWLIPLITRQVCASGEKKWTSPEARHRAKPGDWNSNNRCQPSPANMGTGSHGPVSWVGITKLRQLGLTTWVSENHATESHTW